MDKEPKINLIRIKISHIIKTKYTQINTRINIIKVSTTKTYKEAKVEAKVKVKVKVNLFGTLLYLRTYLFI